MAKPKHNSERGVKQRKRDEHAPGVEAVRVELGGSDTAWHPFSDEPIPGPAVVIYHLHESGDIGVMVTPPRDPGAIV